MTERCLGQLYDQFLKYPKDKFDIFVYDDGSTDGTPELIKEKFPQVHLTIGYGNFFWCKSMHFAMKEATNNGNYDFYLMVNDDVCFEKDALSVMLRSYYRAKESCAVVGAIKAVDTEDYTYGGRDELEKLILPGENIRCTWANWNCFLLDKEIIHNVGIIDGKYQHAFGDYDYSYRMIKAGYNIYVSDRCVGRCNLNSEKKGYNDVNLSTFKRLKQLLSPKGCPFYSYMRYYIKQEGVKGGVRALYGYSSMIGYIVLKRRI